jgi:hypothetical protein
MMSSSPTTVSSVSSWHPISSPASKDMWELPASSSSMSDDREDFHTLGLHQEFSVCGDDDNYSTSTAQERNVSSPMLPMMTIQTNNHRNDQRRYSSSSSSSTTTSNARSRGRNSGIGLSEQRCVLGDATNTLRRKNHISDTRPVQRSYFH